MTKYLAAYDTESIRCIHGVRAIVAQHLKYNAPATFFIVGELLEDKRWAEEIKELMDSPLFEVASHSYTHIIVKPHKSFQNEAPEQSFLRDQIVKTNERLKETFGCDIVGFRTPCGFYEGLKGNTEILRELWDSGIRYVSSMLMGRGDTVPALLKQPFYYDSEDILRPLLELPGHDWHDNVLKGYNFCPITWPPELPWGYPKAPPSTPQEEFAVYKKGLDYAVENHLTYYSPIFHPWSVYRFNSDAETIGLLLEYAQSKNMECANFFQMYDGYVGENKI